MAGQAGSQARDGAARQLNSWKEIAAHLGRETRTIQRWEKEEGLPIHRHLHSKRSSVYAFPEELDDWWRNRPALQAEGQLPNDKPARSQRTRVWLAAAVLSSIAGATWLYSSREHVTPNQLVAIPLTDYTGYELSPAFLPDGDRVVFAWNGEERDNFDVYLKQIGSYPAQRLTRDPRNEYSPAPSPDGRLIAFLRDVGEGKAAVILMPTLGGPEIRLTEITAPLRPSCGPHAPLGSLAWSPDGKWLAISDKTASSEAFGIFAVSVETGERRMFTSPVAPSVGDYAAVFSPDRSALAFCRSTVYGVGEIYLQSVSSDFHSIGKPRRLTFGGQWSISPAWMPAGDALIYSVESGVRGLFMAGISGRTEPQRLTFGDTGSMPALSPRGDRLAFVRRTIDIDIYALPLNQPPKRERPALRVLTSTSRESNMDYSPDGSRIAFQSNRTGSPEVWISAKDGTNAYQATSFGARQTGTPRWSPDGKHIAFDSRSDGAGEIWVMPVEGNSPPRQFTTNPASDLVPSWSRDGRWLYFSSNRTGEYQVWKQPAGGGEAVQITHHGGGHAIESNDGSTLFYSKTLLDSGPGGTSIWRVAVNGGEEVMVLDGVSSWCNFRVANGGIYLIRNGTGADSRPSILFYAFADQSTRTIATIERPVGLGLSIAPDGRRLLYSQVEREDGDLMLVEGFR